jgi:predicted ATP-grasp superfamily ATP-dependent carboligase
MLKPLASGGGHGVRVWHVGERVPRGSFLQARVTGVPGSVLFADGVVIGATRQLIGDPAFGGTGFTYCGNILIDARPEVVVPAGLSGYYGIDVVGSVPIEINPRYTAAMELVERRQRMSIGAVRTVGKAVVYARRSVTVGDTRDWLGDDSVADIPMPNSRVPAGRPICTVFASGRDADECYARLVARASLLYETVERRQVAA